MSGCCWTKYNHARQTGQKRVVVVARLSIKERTWRCVVLYRDKATRVPGIARLWRDRSEGGGTIDDLWDVRCRFRGITSSTKPTPDKCSIESPRTAQRYLVIRSQLGPLRSPTPDTRVGGDALGLTSQGKGKGKCSTGTFSPAMLTSLNVFALLLDVLHPRYS